MAGSQKRSMKKRQTHNKRVHNRTMRGGLWGFQYKNFEQELQKLKFECEGDTDSAKEARKQLIKDNLVFVALVLGAIGSKNKLDFPPVGPTSPDKIKYQDARIRLLLQAISEYNTDPSIIGDYNIVHDDLILGKWGFKQQAAFNLITAASKTARGVNALGDRKSVNTKV